MSIQSSMVTKRHLAVIPALLNTRYSYFTAGLLVVLTAFRLWYSTHLELVGDEAYYWLWSRHLDLCYLDKGPAIAWIIADRPHPCPRALPSIARHGCAVRSAISIDAADHQVEATRQRRAVASECDSAPRGSGNLLLQRPSVGERTSAMKSPVRPWTFALSLTLFACSCYAGGTSREVRPSPLGVPGAGAPSEQAVSKTSDGVTIPGPLRPFLRMAAVSQKASSEEVLPLLARKVAMEGYGTGGKPTERTCGFPLQASDARQGSLPTTDAEPG